MTVDAILAVNPTISDRRLIGTGSSLQIPPRVILGGRPFFVRATNEADQRRGRGLVVPAEAVVDGRLCPPSQQWDEGAVWWEDPTAWSRTADTAAADRWIEIWLGDVFAIDSAIVQADDNDTYQLSYRDPRSSAWVPLWTIPMSAGGGMQTRPNPQDSTVRQVFSNPVTTEALRIEALTGDGMYAVSEVQAFGIPSSHFPTMWPVTGPPHGDTVVQIRGGAGYTSATTATVGIRTVRGMASDDGTAFTFSTPAFDPNLTNPVAVTTSNPTTPGLPLFTYMPTVMEGPEGLGGTVRTPDGSPAAGATVWIIHEYPEGILAETITDADGRYFLAAPTGVYYAAYARTVAPVKEAPSSRPVEHFVGFWGLAIAAGGTTEHDFVLPEMVATGSCGPQTCTVEVSVSGFGPLNPVEIRLGTGPQQVIGTLIPDSSTTARGILTCTRPGLSAGYAVIAATGDFDTYLQTTSSPTNLVVP